MSLFVYLVTDAGVKFVFRYYLNLQRRYIYLDTVCLLNDIKDCINIFEDIL